MTVTNRPRWEDQVPHQCWECGGFCLDYKGSTHGWRCRFCIEVYLDGGWATWTSLGDREQSKRNLASSGSGAPRQGKGGR